MPLACPRCATQNPDGNLYCQSCGAALTAPVGATAAAVPVPPPGPFPGPPPGAFPGPPPGAFPGPPPGFSPPAPVGPGYTLTGPGVPVHRTPWLLIVAAVVLLTVVMAGIGTAVALVANHGAQNSSSSNLAGLPSPTPGLTPSPVASATTTTTPGVVSNDGFSLTLPSGWAVNSKDNESVNLSDPNSQGSVTIGSGVSIPTQTAQQNHDTILSGLKSKYPDTQECPNTKPANTNLNGANGISFQLCFTLTQGASSAPVAASLFTGANASGSAYYVVMVLTLADNLPSYVNTAKPVIQSLHWKLS